jgi:hypothetical protein
VQPAPQLRPADRAERVDPLLRRGIAHVPLDVLVTGADDGEPRGNVLDEALERLQQDRQPLALLRAADEEHPELVRRRLRSARRCIDVDAVGNHAVGATEPAAAGPCSGLRDRDPGVQLVELAPGSERGCDPVGKGLRRIRVEGADHRSLAERAGVPRDRGGLRRVDVHHVISAGAKLAAHRVHAVVEDTEVGDRSVGAEPDGAAEGHQVIGPGAVLGRCAMKHARHPVGRIPGRQHANLVAAREQRSGQRLDVTIHATCVSPRVWADDCDPHRGERLTQLKKRAA